MAAAYTRATGLDEDRRGKEKKKKGEYLEDGR